MGASFHMEIHAKKGTRQKENPRGPDKVNHNENKTNLMKYITFLNDGVTLKHI